MVRASTTDVDGSTGMFKSFASAMGLKGGPSQPASLARKTMVRTRSSILRIGSSLAAKRKTEGCVQRVTPDWVTGSAIYEFACMDDNGSARLMEDGFGGACLCSWRPATV